MASGKKSAFYEMMHAKYKVAMDVQRRFTIQQSADVACIVLNEYFGFGKQRCTEFCEMFAKEMNEFILLALEDDGVDRDLNYTKGKVDERLRKIFKDNSIRFEDRYPKEVRTK